MELEKRQLPIFWLGLVEEGNDWIESGHRQSTAKSCLSWLSRAILQAALPSPAFLQAHPVYLGVTIE